jgi:hypothetical protein
VPNALYYLAIVVLVLLVDFAICCGIGRWLARYAPPAPPETAFARYVERQREGRAS